MTSWNEKISTFTALHFYQARPITGNTVEHCVHSDKAVVRQAFPCRRCSPAFGTYSLLAQTMLPTCRPTVIHLQISTISSPPSPWQSVPTPCRIIPNKRQSSEPAAKKANLSLQRTSSIPFHRAYNVESKGINGNEPKGPGTFCL